VLGIALDGVGYGDDGTIWGGEFLLADYRDYQRLGTFKPVAMIGGAQAVREPWRNAYAHLMAEMGWARFTMNYDELEFYDFLSSKPTATLDQMLKRGINAPLASSCGRLFDAVAAAAGLARESADFEGQGAMMLEAAASDEALADDGEEAAYPFAIPNLNGNGIPYIEPVAMWQALLGDLILKTPVPVVAARFHKGLVCAIVNMTRKLARADSPDGPRFGKVALSGGCFQNKVLLELTVDGLREHGFEVLTQSRVPANDGGIALGQAVIAAARALRPRGE
jgi:hydrogenase maturation protein HypF